MSFSQDQKAEIYAQQLKNTCCRRALLYGILVARGRIICDEISVSLDSRDGADYLGQLIREAYSKDALIGTSPAGGRRVVASFLSKSAEKIIWGFRQGEPLKLKCSQCQGEFLRGIFVACGRVSDPEKQFSLEFSPVLESIEGIVSHFSELGLTPRISEKKNETLIYFRNSADIEDFFGHAAMNNTAFTFMNAKIKRDLRNKANRISNCESNNINRAVSTSMDQISLISELIRRGLISQLPEELEMTARLRMEHSDLSLARLAAIITPPISKPGLSHRLKKITAMAEKLLKIEE